MKKYYRLLLSVFVLLLLFGCGYSRRIAVAIPKPIYDYPSGATLEQKAIFHETAILKWCVDNDGMMLYRCFPTKTNTPFNGASTGLPKNLWPLLSYEPGLLSDSTWQNSYNVADFPAWQAEFLAGLAFKMAVTGESEEANMLKLLNGLKVCYEVTGIPGLLVRSYIKHESDTPLPWMKTYSQAKDEKNLAQGYWLQGKNGYWFRNGIAGGHYQAVFTAMCVIGALSERGDIQLTNDAKSKFKSFFQPMYNYIRKNDYKIIDTTGKVSGYGNMKTRGVVGQYATWQLSLNRAAILWSVTAPDAKKNQNPTEEYDNIKDHNSRIAKRGYELLVDEMEVVPLQFRATKPNDIRWRHQSWLALYIKSSDTSEKYMTNINKGMTKFWNIHDPFNLHNYSVQMAARPGFQDIPMDLSALYGFRWYPLNKFTFQNQVTVKTKDWQPIQNRVIESSYAKGYPYKQATIGDHNGLRSSSYQCGFDYVFIYWLSRYYNIFSRFDN